MVKGNGGAFAGKEGDAAVGGSLSPPAGDEGGPFREEIVYAIGKMDSIEEGWVLSLGKEGWRKDERVLVLAGSAYPSLRNFTRPSLYTCRT